MKDRPILFNAPMVRAVLDDSKTQTRRIVKRKPLEWLEAHNFSPEYVALSGNDFSPYGQPGDRLWVRESHWWFKDEPDHSCGYYPPKLTADHVMYRADGDDGRRVWRPSIHMPRWASRITLEITAVRIERLQDISDTDAEAEGTPCYVCGGAMDGRSEADCHCFHVKAKRNDYRTLWESINGTGSWVANPWVWVIEFKRVEP